VGSYNNLQKVTREVISVWAAILNAVPDALLILKNFALADSLVKERCRQIFAEFGIAADRLEFRARDNTVAEHLNSYSTIDIALDTFPYNGATTTCEALWMGVPVITLAGNMHAGRVGVSLLSQVGLASLIAETTDNYIKIAVDLARNRHELPETRSTLRERMASSPLCNEDDFTRNVEAAYRAMWLKWCSKSA
jgi:protein O-GlcNAc transferase